ncbi:hypothetical protein FKM82_007453 [Ascaphus truei]
MTIPLPPQWTSPPPPNYKRSPRPKTVSIINSCSFPVSMLAIPATTPSLLPLLISISAISLMPHELQSRLSLATNIIYLLPDVSPTFPSLLSELGATLLNIGIAVLHTSVAHTEPG